MALEKPTKGNGMKARAIRYAVAHGLETYELLGSSAAWTQVWTKHERPSVSVRAYPFTVRGMTALAEDGVKSLAARLKRPKDES